jgi:MFS family permease
MDRSRVTTVFINLGHFLDHLAMLVFPTAVLAMTAEFGRSYAEMLPLALGGFLAFGAGSLPAGWLGDRWGRRPMMIVFFLGVGGALVLAGLAQNAAQLVIVLTLVGLFASIYHPVGIAMLVKDQAKVGRALGWNGVWGNLGLACAALLAGWLSTAISWRAAFILPGLFAAATGIAFALLVPAAPALARQAASGPRRHIADATARRVFILLAIATICSGVIFNATTIVMPKLFDERLSALVDTPLGVGTLVAGIYAVAAMAQLLVGRMIDGRSLRAVFLPLALLQVPLVLLIGALGGSVMLAISLATMFVVFGLIPINDAMVARYAQDEWRSRVYALRYVVSFGASSCAVPLVALLPPQGSGFAPLFAVLAVIALGTLGAALLFPAGESAAAPAPQPAE